MVKELFDNLGIMLVHFLAEGLMRRLIPLPFQFPLWLEPAATGGNSQPGSVQQLFKKKKKVQLVTLF